MGKKGLIDFSSVFVQSAGFYSEDDERQKKKARVYNREEYILNPPADVAASKGEDQFRLFLDYLENKFWPRHIFQREFHEKALKVLAESIVGPEDWPQVGPLLVEEFGWDMSNTSTILLGIAPRRFGKTFALAMLMAAGALVVPSLTQAVFATALRISMNMGKYIKDAILMAGEGHRMKYGAEKILVFGPNPGDTREISCYPANPKISFFFLGF